MIRSGEQYKDSIRDMWSLYDGQDALNSWKIRKGPRNVN
jgi:hypothetical protein